MREILRFEPIYQERVWGGRVLESTFERVLPAGQPIGESWEIVDRPEAQSVVRAGNLKGTTLRKLIETRGAEVMGPGWPAERAFPILVKWLDCRERLSLQVHPPASVANELKGEPKTENGGKFTFKLSGKKISGIKGLLPTICLETAGSYQSRAGSELFRPPGTVTLGKNKKAKAFFDQLDKTNRYAFCWRVQTAKKPETRVARVEKFVAMLAKGEKIHG